MLVWVILAPMLDLDKPYLGLDMATWGALAAGVVLILALLAYFVKRAGSTSEDRLIEKSIKSVSEAYLRNVIVSDGLYGYHFVDYLVLLKGKILALDVLDLHGYIFGGENTDEWAQVLKSQSKNFANPLHKMNMFSQRIHSLLDSVEVEGRVIFTSQSSFPKGVPAGVFTIDHFKQGLAELSRDDYMNESMHDAWDKLVALTREHKVQYEQELKGK